MFRDHDPEALKVLGIKESPFLAGITHIDRSGSWSEARAELVHNFFYENVLSSGSKSYGRSGSEGKWNATHLANLGVVLREGMRIGEILAKARLPFEGVELAYEPERAGFDLIAVKRAVDRAAGLVRVGDHQASLFELVKGEPADGLTGVWRPILFVVLGGELHDRSYALEGFSCLGP